MDDIADIGGRSYGEESIVLTGEGFGARDGIVDLAYAGIRNDRTGAWIGVALGFGWGGDGGKCRHRREIHSG